MKQSGFLLGALFVAFIVWIITKGELSTYLGFFTISNSNATASETGNSTQNSGGGLLGSSNSNPLLTPGTASQSNSSNPLLENVPENLLPYNAQTGQAYNPLLNPANQGAHLGGV